MTIAVDKIYNYLLESNKPNLVLRSFHTIPFYFFFETNHIYIYLSFYFRERMLNSIIRRQDYISLVNPSPSCLHKSRVRARAYIVGQRWERDSVDAKIHYISSYPYFEIGRVTEGYPKSSWSHNPSKHHPLFPNIGFNT